jgi:molybdopterin molybdotransferase
MQQDRVLKLASYEKVEKIIEEIEVCTGYESIPAHLAYARILAEDVIVTHDIPEFDKSAIDGYAFSSSTTAPARNDSPLEYQIIGEIFPDDRKPRSIKPHQTMYVACGAPIPEGADCVIKFEQVHRSGDRIQVFSPFVGGKNISRRGEDFKAGTALFRSNHLLRPQDVGALISIGCRSVKVLARPLIGVLSVGDELTEAEKPFEGYQVNDHAYVVLGFLRELGAYTTDLGICPDDEDTITQKLAEGLKRCDMIITMGGGSVGRRDMVPRVLAELPNAKMLFHGIRVSPGKVTGLASVNSKPVVMLAGHIVTAAAGFFMVCLPILRRMLNLPRNQQTSTVDAKLAKDVKTKPKMARFLFARIRVSNGELVAEPFGFETNLLSTLVAANSYALVPQDFLFRAGETLTFALLNQHNSGWDYASLNSHRGR